MKNGVLIILLIGLICSCSETKKNKTDQTKNESFMSAKIDGKHFISKELNYTFLSKINTISLTAVSKDKTEKFRFQIIYDNGPATYSVGEGTDKSGNMIYTYNKDHWIASKKRGKGTITLTEKDDYLIGEFSFTGEANNNTKHITEGKFKIVKNK